MKRKISSVVILGLIALLTIFSNYSIKKLTTNFSNQINNIIISAKNEDAEKASIQIKELKQSFKNKKHLLEFFIKRDYIANISVSINGFEAYVNKDTWRDLESEAAKTLEQIAVVEHLFFRII